MEDKEEDSSLRLTMMLSLYAKKYRSLRTLRTPSSPNIHCNETNQAPTTMKAKGSVRLRESPIIQKHSFWVQNINK